MPPGAITEQIDVTQLVFGVFCLFFAGLVFYLRREDKREGYPLEDPAGGEKLVGFPLPPPPKVYKLLKGGTAAMPHDTERPVIAAEPRHRFPGAPLVPTGDPLVDGVGPAAFALRSDDPLYAKRGVIQVQPLRNMDGWRVVEGDADPRGMTVVGADGVAVGVVRDLWIDRSVKILRYLELETTPELGARTVLLPIYYADVRKRQGRIKVSAMPARRFADVPGLRDPDRISAGEEDRVNAYFAGGPMYAGAAWEVLP